MNEIDSYSGPDLKIMRSLIQRIATGPEMSKAITRKEARAGMRLVLESRVSQVQAAIFLISLRMKRETDDENLGILEALQQGMTSCVAPTEVVIDISDPYDGYIRTLPPSPFLPAVLSASGIPAVCHGLESVGPKFGVTTRQVLREAGADVDLPMDQAADRLGDPRIGWSYIDQKVFGPQLHNLVALRNLMVKRTCISTIENMLAPIRGRQATHLMTGYVHKAYPRLYGLLAQNAGYDGALIIRGNEGGVIPSLRHPATCFDYRLTGELRECQLNPADLAIAADKVAVPLPKALAAIENNTVRCKHVAEHAARAGLEALKGQSGPARDSLIYAAAAVLRHVGIHESLQSAAENVREVIDSGMALERFIAK